MPIEQTFSYITPPGVKYVSLDDWVKTLPGEDQRMYAQARERQDQNRQKAIDDGRLIILEKGRDGAYVWRDAEAMEQGKETDPIWLSYSIRWEEETGIKFNDEKKEL